VARIPIVRATLDRKIFVQTRSINGIMRRYFSCLADDEVDWLVLVTEIPRLLGSGRDFLVGG
jgi:hypothetical protein